MLPLLSCKEPKTKEEQKQEETYNRTLENLFL